MRQTKTKDLKQKQTEILNNYLCLKHLNGKSLTTSFGLIFKPTQKACAQNEHLVLSQPTQEVCLFLCFRKASSAFDSKMIPQTPHFPVTRFLGGFSFFFPYQEHFRQPEAFLY